MEWRIGCSGFSYNDWQGIFYPDELPQSEWLQYYARYFDTLELNASFYKFPSLTFFKNFYKKSPADFGVVVKAPKLITHINKFIDVDGLMDNVYATIRDGLRDKLQAVLFQLPPSFSFSEERLEKIITVMDPSFVNVVEFRHRSWWNNRVYKTLGRENISFCGVSHPMLPDDVIINSATPYYRLHGVPKLYYSMYEEEFLKATADTLQKNPNITKAFLLFNNTATRAALENASFMQEYVEL